MLGLLSRLLARRRAWKIAVSLSAGLLIRDHGQGAYVAARNSARQALAEKNNKAFLFWGAVAREVAGREGEVISKHEPLDSQ
jgi:hypothetical protein